MKLTVKQVVEGAGSLKEIMSLKLPGKTAYKLSKVSRKLQGVLDDFAAGRKAILEEYQEPDEKDATKFIIPAAKVEAFSNAMDAILDEEVDLDIEAFPLEALGKNELRPIDLMNLDWLITE